MALTPWGNRAPCREDYSISIVMGTVQGSPQDRHGGGQGTPSKGQGLLPGTCRTSAPAPSFGPGSGSTPSIRAAPRPLGMGALVKVMGLDPSLRRAEIQSHTKDCHPSLLLGVLCGPKGAKSL